MINEEVVIKQFASYCRKILKYEKIDYYRERKYTAEHELRLEMFEDYEMRKRRKSHSRKRRMSSHFDSRTKIVTKTDRN